MVEVFFGGLKLDDSSLASTMIISVVSVQALYECTKL